MLLAMALFLKGQNAEEERMEILHSDFGEWIIKENGHQTGIAGYSTFEKIVMVEEFDYQFANAQVQRKVERKFEPKEITYYVYRVYLESRSLFHGDSTGTWVYGARVFVNGYEESKDLYPDGFMVFVGVEPSRIFKFEAKEKPENIKFEVEWKEAAYEPRILK